MGVGVCCIIIYRASYITQTEVVHLALVVLLIAPMCVIGGGEEAASMALMAPLIGAVNPGHRGLPAPRP